ncbi:hypothetical protein ZANY_75 [Gordonia phage Zany]|uniref:Uncharacterized protein n=1 Tax=Gordonia phage Zany TaxID=2910759 RepID=A0AA49GZ08_9CAUD|nr:hypothetical protein ZANY_75 [Gordonia phage Zany]
MDRAEWRGRDDRGADEAVSWETYTQVLMLWACMLTAAIIKEIKK